MKYLIITKKHLNILKLSVLTLIVILITVGIFKLTVPKTVKTFSHEDIFKTQLPKESEKWNFKNFSEKIIGFSIENPTSIISDYSPALFEVKDKSTPPPVQTPEPTNPPLQHVQEKQITGGQKIKNQTKYQINLADFENEALNIKEPNVLIVHTHTTESYAPEDENMYFINDNSRSTDNERNMISIGKIIGDCLKNHGINVIHDETFHDYPVYNGAYGRSLSTIKTQQMKKPEINVVLDIHRDAVVAQDGSQVKVLTEQNGQKTAQIMLVVGTDGGGLSHPGWRDNLTFASKIQKKAEENYPGLIRPLNLREERFNQHTTPCSIIVEVGTNANTLSEAKAGAKLIGEIIALVLKENTSA